jgi:hypothetical protein
MHGQSTVIKRLENLFFEIGSNVFNLFRTKRFLKTNVQYRKS